MSVNEVYTRPSTENVLSYIADKFERKGMFPSGEECVPVVLEKLENEEIMLPAHNYHIYINKVCFLLTTITSISTRYVLAF